MIEIDDSVPMPAHLRGRTPIYPLQTMELGESFFVPKKSGISMRASCGYIQRKTGRKFAVRTVDGGVRVWSTK